MKVSERPSSSLERWAWTAIFYLSGAVFLACLVAILSFSYFFDLFSWIYFLATGSAVAFAIAAVQRERLTLDMFNAADDASWITRVFRRSSKDSEDRFDMGDD